MILNSNTATNSIETDTVPLHVNLTSYDNVEMLENFDSARFDSYCQNKLENCQKHVTFIQNHCDLGSNWQGKICEMGSGNSRLLYRLERENLLQTGLGIEISPSRHQFAEAFKAHIGSKKVTNVNENIFDFAPPQQCDLLLGVDIALQLMTPVAADAEKNLFAWMRKAVKPNGYLILEMWDLHLILKQLELAAGCLQYWKEFPESDPFEFILMQVKQNEDDDLVWKKTFIKRNSLERSYFDNVIRPYSRQRITSLLKMSGFGKVDIFDYWNTPGDTNDEGEYIVLAQKTS